MNTEQRAGPDQPEDLPPDPDAYDSPRATQARARGLAAPYIAGGEDPDPEETRRQERPYLLLLIVMTVVVVLAGFVLGVIQNLLAGG
ncbi:MAG TPA: hypothetical protein VHR16_01720 [Candidatus Limnocylindrales bacterium]|nr:hypothetical protein [Candidatus Limnocylindrales bacterium]